MGQALVVGLLLGWLIASIIALLNSEEDNGG